MSAPPALALWCDGAHGARENMRRDAALLAAVAEGGRAFAVLRLFAFAPPGITLGRSQRPEQELDLARLEREAIEWAVRPTGGRAIFHDEEWTFSLATPLGPRGWAADPTAAYARTCGVLATALRALGVPAALAPGSARGVGRPRAAGGPAAACFASTARHELTRDGRKLAGIAQRVAGGALLQQGSLLLGDSHLRLADYQRTADAERERRRAVLAAASAHAGDVLGPHAALEWLAGALAAVLPEARRLEGEAGWRELGGT